MRRRTNMLKIESNGLMCTHQCPYLVPPGGCGFECKLIEQVFGSQRTGFYGPGYRCPFAVLREVLVVKEPAPKVEQIDHREQCRGCRWDSIRKCAPPLNGGPCLDREVDNPPTPVRADAVPTACRLDALRLEGVLRQASASILEILSAPAAETRTCSGNLMDCSCMRCRMKRLQFWILQRLVTP